MNNVRQSKVIVKKYVVRAQKTDGNMDAECVLLTISMNRCCLDIFLKVWMDLQLFTVSSKIILALDIKIEIFLFTDWQFLKSHNSFWQYQS